MRGLLAISALAMLAACGPGDGSTAGATAGTQSPLADQKMAAQAATVTPTPTPTTTPWSGHPNVVVLLVDDLGWKDVGFMGSTFYSTPNIDRLAKQGVIFDQAYSAEPICSPTRAALMTGTDPVKLGMTTIINDAGPPANSLLIPPPFVDRLPLAATTLAERFKAAGYATMFAGKWHLGPIGADAYQYWPEKQGFDINAGGTSAGNPTGLPGQEYFSPYRNQRLKDGPVGEYLTDRLGDETVRFINSHQAQPFFVMHAFYGVHTPLNPAAKFIAAYQAKVAALNVKGQAALPLLMGFNIFAKAAQDNAVYGSMVSAVDDVVGRIMAELDQDNLTSNTVVVFASDNGGLANQGWGATSNGPLRGGKTWLYEGGIRVPLAIRAPGAIQSGVHSTYPTTTVDLVPTILHLANLPSSDPSFDGVDLFAPGQTSKARDLFWHFPHYEPQGMRPGDAVRSGNWKMVEFFEDNRDELYDLSKDPGEQHDLASKEKAVVANLRAKLANWRTQVGAKMPTKR